jgi:2'-5' RNA ligase
VKSSFVVIAELTGPIADRIHAIQERYDPRLAAELPPHVTLAGSSGMGPIAAGTTVAELRAKLEPIASSTAPIPIRLQPPTRFMQTELVVLPLEPHGPLRTLHERIKTAGLRYEQARFEFTPHCTLSFYPQLTPRSLRDLLAIRIDDPLTIERIQCCRRAGTGRSSAVLELQLRPPE